MTTLPSELLATLVYRVDASGLIASVGNAVQAEADASQQSRFVDLFVVAEAPRLDLALADGMWSGRCRMRTGDEAFVRLRRMTTLGGTDAELLAEVEAGGKASLLGAIAMQDILDQVEELARVGCFDWQPETGRVAWSPGLHAIYGLEVGDFGGTVGDFASYIHEDDRARVLHEIATGIEQEQSFRIGERIRCADGTVRHLESSGRVVHRADGQPFRVVGACRDVTDRETYAKSLEWQVAGLELLAEVARELLSVASVVAKPAIADTLLRRLARHLDCDHYSFFDVGASHAAPGDAEAQLHLEEWNRTQIARSAGDDATSDELPPVWRLAGVRAAQWTLLGNQGEALGAIAFGTTRQDVLSTSQVDFIRTLGRLVTASLVRARSRRELEAQEERFRTLFDCAGDAIFLVSQDGRIMDANREACASLGYSRAELLSMHVRDIQASEPDMMPVLREAATGGRVGVHRGAFRQRDGGHMDVEVRLRASEGCFGSLVVAVARDVSERERLQKQVLQSQKLQALGLLAGGVAHDFNNLLTIMGGTCELMLLEEALPARVRESVQTLISTCGRAAALTSQLLLCSRSARVEVDVVDLALVLRSAEDLLRRAVGDGIVLDLNVDAEELPVIANTSQLDRVLHNLVSNARDAMPGEGRIELGLRRVDVTPEASSLDLPAGSYAELTVRDCGQGIEANVLGRIFEPYFTTKPRGAGNGLGLTIVQGIVDQARGHLRVQSTPGKGTTFSIHLPLATGAADAAAVDFSAARS